MTSFRSAVFALPMTIALGLPAMAADPVTLETEEQKISYALGLLYGARISDTFPTLDLDGAAAVGAVAAALGQSDPQMTEQEAQTMLQAYAQKAQAEADAAREAMAATFFTDNGAKEGVMTTESGLQYKVVATGEGDSPTPADTVSVHYEGRLLNGKVFDSSIARGEPAQFPVSGVIAGWTEALQLMSPGGKLEVWIPSELAYGERGAGQDIGPNEILNFDMELLSIIK